VTAAVDQEIRRIVGGLGHLAVPADALGDRDDLFRLGMTSHANVNVMLALEEAFDIEFPEELLRRSTFQSLSAIRAAVLQLLDELMTA
jgi:acyl carrier protein